MVDFYAGANPITLLCPIKNGTVNNQSFAALTRDYLEYLDHLPLSPFAEVPETYLCRFYILNDVFFEGLPAKEDHLKSKYLVFSGNYHGDFHQYLTGMWENATETVKALWQYCVSFDAVKDSHTFIEYIEKCSVKTTFFFNGSNGRPLQEQLKALYLKQELTQFAVENQSKSPQELRQAFQQFVARCKPDNNQEPAWPPGLKSFEHFQELTKEEEQQ